MTDLCPECGAFLEDDTCPKCGWEAPEPAPEIPQLLDGYKITRSIDTWIIKKVTPDGEEAILNFKSIGSGNSKMIAAKLEIDIKIVDRQLAALAEYLDEEKERAKEIFNDEEEEEPKIIYKPTPTIQTQDFIAEQIWDGKSPPRFVIKHFNKEEYSYTDQIDLGETDGKGCPIIYIPVYNDHLVKGMVTVPRKPEPCTLRELIEDVFKFVGNPTYYDPCGKIHQVKLLALICTGSWFHDKMKPQTSIPVAGVGRFAPIIPIRGPSGSGKNRLANLLRFICYHPYFDLSKTNIPSLFRPLDMWRGVLIMDESDVKNTGATSELTRFLNSRATGTPIARQNPDNVSESQAFHSFGLTMVTQRQHFDDNATEDRSVPYYSEKTTVKIPTIELDEIVEFGLDIQDKLLYIRLNLWSKITIDKTRWHPHINDARLNASLLPVFALAEHEAWILEVVDEVAEILEAAKRRRKAASIDGQLVNHIWGKIENHLFDIHEGKYYVLKTHILETDEHGNEKETKTPLIATHIKEEIGLGYKTIRKVWDSINVSPDDDPGRLRVGKRVYRVYWFNPPRLEKMLCEFVVGYPAGRLYQVLGILPPDSVTDVPDVTGMGVRGDLSECCVSNVDTIPIEPPNMVDTTLGNTLTPKEPSQPSHLSQNEGKTDENRSLTIRISDYVKTVPKGPTRLGLEYRFKEDGIPELNKAIDEAIQLDLIYCDPSDGRYKAK